MEASVLHPPAIDRMNPKTIRTINCREIMTEKENYKEQEGAVKERDIDGYNDKERYNDG